MWGRKFFSTVPRWSVAIVGRANVGKSTLFNRIQSSDRNVRIEGNMIDKAIVFDQAGTTREGKSVACQFGRLAIDLHDTGGIEEDELTNMSPLLSKMRAKVLDTIKRSHLVLLVVDAKNGIVPNDKVVADIVGKNLENSDQRIVLVANKAEGSMMECVADCYDLNLGDPVLISAKANEGIDDLYDRMVLELDPTGTSACTAEDDQISESYDEHEYSDEEEEIETISDSIETSMPRNEVRRILKSTDPSLAKMKSQILTERQMALIKKPVQIAIIGRPNAGKSSLLNALVREDRAIVDDVAGTTTDTIAVNWNFYNHQLRLIDTAGIMRGWKHATGGADFKDPGAQTLRTINTSHVCVLVIDAHEAFKSNTLKFPSRQEVKLGHEVIDAGKCLVVAVNKWDMIPEKQRPQFRRGLTKCVQDAFFDVKGVPVVFISTTDGFNLNTLLVSCVSVYRKWNMKLQSSKLNGWLEAFVAHNPPPWKDGQKQYPKFIAQTRTRPPTFSLYTNTFATFPDNYLRQMKELLKEEFGLRGVPLRINLRSTLMPKPGKRLRDRDIARWKRLGPRQAAAVDKIRRKKSRASSEYNEID